MSPLLVGAQGFRTKVWSYFFKQAMVALMLLPWHILILAPLCEIPPHLEKPSILPYPYYCLKPQSLKILYICVYIYIYCQYIYINTRHAFLAHGSGSWLGLSKSCTCIGPRVQGFRFWVWLRTGRGARPPCVVRQGLEKLGLLQKTQAGRELRVV